MGEPRRLLVKKLHSLVVVTVVNLCGGSSCRLWESTGVSREQQHKQPLGPYRAEELERD